MTPDVPVFFATTEGQTRRIAERIAARLRQRSIDSRAIDMASPDAEAIDWARVRAAVVGASLHIGRHQKAAVAFVRRHLDALNGRPSAFFSVSLSAGSANPVEVQAAAELARRFVASAGWHPQQVDCLAGRLAYTQYGLLTRFFMRRIARKEGASTDTSRDHEYTDWNAVDALADRVAGQAG
jgi:menaquinone-dependent protoporphyrinogen oxidase